MSTPRVTTRDGRVLTLSDREAVIIELLLDLRSDLARVEVGSIQFHVEHSRVRAKVETWRTERQMEMRAAASR